MWTKAALIKALRKHKKLRLFVENTRGTHFPTARWRYVTLKSCKYKCADTMDSALVSCFMQDIEGRVSGSKIIRAMWAYDIENQLKVVQVRLGPRYRSEATP